MTPKRNKDFFDKFLQDFEDDEVVDVAEFNMGYVPFIIDRVDDGERLQLNKDNKTYSFVDLDARKARGGNMEYTWGRLFRDHRCVNCFVATSWVKIDNLESAHKALEK